MRTDQWLVDEWRRRADGQSRVLEMMRQTQSLVNGDIVVPLPEMDRAEQPAVANLTAEAVDQLGMRVASTSPSLHCPPLRPRSKASQREADRRRNGIKAYWRANRLHRLNRRRARMLVAYGAAPVSIIPDTTRGIPKWVVRSPLTTYPSPEEFYDEYSPADVIFAYRRTCGWMRDNYPRHHAEMHPKGECSQTDPVEIIEYHDSKRSIAIAAGVRGDWEWGQQGSSVVMHTETCRLYDIEHGLGICPVATPHRMTLDRIGGQFSQLMGMHQAQARLMALELIAVEKHVFPDLVLVPNAPNATPSLVGNVWHDGRTGRINIVKNGQVDTVQINPGVQTVPIMDLLERNQRVGGGIPAQWGGEVPTNTRTGRAGEVTMSAAIDFRVQELQETMADSVQTESIIGMRMARKLWGDTPRSFHIGLPAGMDEGNDFTPNKDFTTEVIEVKYAMPGADANGLVIATGQRVGAGMMSRDTARDLDPLIEDANMEGDKVRSEQLEQALMASIQQMASQGQIPPGDVALIMKLHFEQDVDLAEAVEKAQKIAQERQAEKVAEDSPAAQPGLALPGAGAESTPMPTVDAPPQGLGNLRKLLDGLVTPQRMAGDMPAQVAG